MKVVYANLCDLDAMEKLSMNHVVELIVMLTVLYRVSFIISFFNDPSDIILAYLPHDRSTVSIKGVL